MQNANSPGPSELLRCGHSNTMPQIQVLSQSFGKEMKLSVSRWREHKAWEPESWPLEEAGTDKNRQERTVFQTSRAKSRSKGFRCVSGSGIQLSGGPSMFQSPGSWTYPSVFPKPLPLALATFCCISSTCASTNYIIGGVLLLRSEKKVVENMRVCHLNFSKLPPHV